MKLAFALLALIALPSHAASGADASNSADVVQRFQTCVGPVDGHPWSGNRSIIDARGGALVYQCGDGKIWIWSYGKLTEAARGGLVSVAASSGVLPGQVRCPTEASVLSVLAPSHRQDSGRADKSGKAAEAIQQSDCDVIDHNVDWTSYVTGYEGIMTLASASQPLRLVPGYAAAIVLPRLGAAKSVIDGAGGFARLETRTISEWTAEPLVSAPIVRGLFQNEETTFHSIKWSEANGTIIVACSGGFVFFDHSVAFLRAYSRDGRELWTIRRPLPKPASPGVTHAGTTMIQADFYTFANGKFAVVTHSGELPPAFEIVDLRDGRTIATMQGHPIAASELAYRLLVRTGDSTLTFYDLKSVVEGR